MRWSKHVEHCFDKILNFKYSIIFPWVNYIFFKYVICNVTDFTVDVCYFRINGNLCMLRQDRNKNTIRFGNVVQGQVTFSWWGFHCVDGITFAIWFNFEKLLPNIYFLYCGLKQTFSYYSCKHVFNNSIMCTSFLQIN